MSIRRPSACICQPRQASRSAVVLAASRGRGLEAVTTDRPKVMLPIAGKPLLRWLVDAFKTEHVNDITVVGGYRADAIDTSGIKLVVNERYAETSELASLACAVDALESDTVISYGDLLFRSYVLRDLVDSKADFSRRRGLVANRSKQSDCARFRLLLAADDRGLFGTPVLLKKVVSGKQPAAPENGDAADSASGRWIGMLNVSRAGLAKLKTVLAAAASAPRFRRARHAGADERADLGGRADRSAVRPRPLARRQRSGGFPPSTCDFAHAQTPFGSTPDSRNEALHDRGAPFRRGRA